MPIYYRPVSLCPREELNPYQFLRRKLLYPLSYGDKTSLLKFCRETYLHMSCPETLSRDGITKVSPGFTEGELPY